MRTMNEQEQSFPEVLDALFEDETVRISLLHRLSDLTREDMDTFCRRWFDVPVERREAIMRHMADLTEENYIIDFAPIFSFCLADEHPPVRQAALDGMWDATDVSLVEPIVRLLKGDPRSEVRAAAAGSLAHYLLMAEWGQLPQDISPPIVAALLEAYQNPEQPLNVRGRALEALGPITEPRVVTLIEEAYDSDFDDLQRSAIFAMGTSADPRWMSIVVHEMESPVAEMRAEAARAAGTIGSSDAVPQLMELVYDDDEDVARMALLSLGQIGGDRVLRFLDQVLMDPDLAYLHDVAEDALEEVSWLGGELELFDFDDALDHEDDDLE